MTKQCPAECGRMIKGNEILCRYCLAKIAADTRRGLASAWRGFQRSFSSSAMAEYDRWIRRATREALLANSAAKDQSELGL